MPPSNKHSPSAGTGDQSQYESNRGYQDNFAVVIPARYESSRFPGKPLANIAGVSLIERVWRRCTMAVPVEKIIIATDDQRIKDHCESFGADVEMTDYGCLTGTDRVQQTVQQRKLDWAVNVQGDEPMVRPEDIQSVVRAFLSANGQRVINAMAPITDSEEWLSLAVPKLVFDQHDRLLYMSRAPIPGNKASTLIAAWKQVCIYAFSAEHLTRFVATDGKTPFEAIEDIEILRFVEQGIPVQMVRVESGTVAVDFPEDVARAEAVIAKLREEMSN